MADADKRVRGIDLLRGLCIIAVILNHINLRIRLNESSLGKLIGDSANSAVVWNGYYAVRIFFVISGFLIATWSLRRWKEFQDVNIRQFYTMRFARIVPCLVGLLVVLAVLDRLGVPRFTINTEHTSLGRALLAALTFHINWLEARTGYLPAGWDILWSLSVEEVFYFFFPLLCRLFRKQGLLIAVFCAFVIVAPFARVYTPQGLWVDYGYLSCMDGIALGCVAALVAARIKFGRTARGAFIVTGIALAALITIFHHTVNRSGLSPVGLDVTVLNIGIALLLIALQQRFDQRATETASVPPHSVRPKAIWGSVVGFPGAVLRWYGRDSYEVYLTHMLVVWPMVGLFHLTHQPINMAPVWFIAAIGLAGLLGHVVSRYYSEPQNRALRTRLIPAKPRNVTAPTASPSRELA